MNAKRDGLNAALAETVERIRALRLFIATIRSRRLDEVETLLTVAESEASKICAEAENDPSIKFRKS